MKLAEALLLRAEMQTKVERLRERIAASAVVQQGDKPGESAEKLMREAAGILDDLAALVAGINRANMKHKLPDGRTLMEAIAERDSLKQHHALLLHAAAATKREPDRYGMREIKWVVQLDAAKLNKQADDVAGKLRELNARIQETNWKAKLEE
jgi:hypothetical protein